MQFDVAIVGGGLGGLSAEAYLVQQGKKVLLVEQHNIVGRGSHLLPMKANMVFEVGLHEFDEIAHQSK